MRPYGLNREITRSSSMQLVPLLRVEPQSAVDAQQIGWTSEHTVQPTFVVDTKPSWSSTPKIVPRYRRSTDAVCNMETEVQQQKPTQGLFA